MTNVIDMADVVDRLRRSKDYTLSSVSTFNDVEDKVLRKGNRIQMIRNMAADDKPTSFILMYVEECVGKDPVAKYNLLKEAVDAEA